MKTKYTTIQISIENKNILSSMLKKGDSYNTAIKQLLIANRGFKHESKKKRQ